MVIVRLVFHYFQSQADVTAFNVSFNVYSKAWIEVFLGDEFSSFVKVKVTS